MKRRSFLAGGVATAASSALGRLAHSQPTRGRARRSWNLLEPPHRYVIRLNGPAVIGDCYGPGDDTGGDISGQQPPPTAKPFERAAMILYGSERRPVSWRV